MYSEIYNFYHHLQAFKGSEMTIGCIPMYYNEKKLFKVPCTKVDNNYSRPLTETYTYTQTLICMDIPAAVIKKYLHKGHVCYHLILCSNVIHKTILTDY